MVFACMRLILNRFSNMFTVFIFSHNAFSTARHLRQGCDGLHSGNVGKLAVGFEVNLKTLSQSFLQTNFFRRLEQCSGFRLSSQWPNKRSKVTTKCSHQPSKGYMLRLLRNIIRERGELISENMAEEGEKMQTIPFDPRFPNQV